MKFNNFINFIYNTLFKFEILTIRFIEVILIIRHNYKNFILMNASLI
jgi:hypothetical protein